MLIACARQNGELDGPVFAASNDYYQWAVLKIVGRDISLVLRHLARARGLVD